MWVGETVEEDTRELCVRELPWVWVGETVEEDTRELSVRGSFPGCGSGRQWRKTHVSCV